MRDAQGNADPVFGVLIGVTAQVTRDECASPDGGDAAAAPRRFMRAVLGSGARVLGSVWGPALLYLAVRGLGTLIFWGMTAAQDRIDWRPWDADWYLKIAEHGYVASGVGMLDASGTPSPDGAYAFFPLYPMVVRLFAAVFGDNYTVAGIVVSTLAGVVGAYGMARLTRLLGGNSRAEAIAVVLVAAAPMSVVYTLPYPESLLIALVVWALVALLERRWWLFALLTGIAGTSNPMAGPLIVVAIVAACAAVDERGQRRWWAGVTPLLAAAGMLGYLFWVAANTARGYFHISEVGWGNRIDGGLVTAEWVFDAVTTNRDLFVVVTAVAIVASVVAVVLVRRQMPWPVWLYTLGTVALIVVHSGLVQDRVRLLLSAFPLLILAAIRLTRCSTRVAVVITGLVSLFGLWFGAYALAVWPHAI